MLEKKTKKYLLKIKNMKTLTPESKKKLINLSLIILTVPVIAILALAGACKAWDSFVYSSLENSLKTNIEAKKSIAKACDASYEALLAYKNENKIALTGGGNPCSF